MGSISRLIESGVKSDEHAFGESFNKVAKEILLILLEQEPGEEFDIDSDAVFVAINSPRGRVLEALINLSLRTCRTADRATENHNAAWKAFETVFDSELRRVGRNEFEFCTLVANYLPNFLYMSSDWTLENLPNIFDQSNDFRWRFAMQGYTYVTEVYEPVYRYLRDNGDFLRALNDEKLKDKVQEKVIQNIVVAYFNNFESLEDETSLISDLLVRKRHSELSQLIWFVWTHRDSQQPDLKEKVFVLWSRLNSLLDTTLDEDRKLASKLCTWISFVTKANELNKELILQIVEFADEDHNAYEVLDGIARISERDTDTAVGIWLKVLQRARPDFPEEAIIKAFGNLVKRGASGIRDAKRIADEYVKVGNVQPANLLESILDRRKLN